MSLRGAMTWYQNSQCIIPLSPSPESPVVWSGTPGTGIHQFTYGPRKVSSADRESVEDRTRPPLQNCLCFFLSFRVTNLSFMFAERSLCIKNWLCPQNNSRATWPDFSSSQCLDPLLASGWSSHGKHDRFCSENILLSLSSLLTVSMNAKPVLDNDLL